MERWCTQEPSWRRSVHTDNVARSRTSRSRLRSVAMLCLSGSFKIRSERTDSIACARTRLSNFNMSRLPLVLFESRRKIVFSEINSVATQSQRSQSSLSIINLITTNPQGKPNFRAPDHALLRSTHQRCFKTTSSPVIMDVGPGCKTTPALQRRWSGDRRRGCDLAVSTRPLVAPLKTPTSSKKSKSNEGVHARGPSLVRTG